MTVNSKSVLPSSPSIISASAMDTPKSSSSIIVPVASPSRISTASSGLVRLTVKVSLGSFSSSPIISTLMV